MDYVARMIENAAPDPIARFQELLEQAKAAVPKDYNAMTLATVGPDGRPSARIVLLKAVDERGFVFYTNTLSRKGSELDGQRFAALCFYWPALDWQVRVEGPVTRVSDSEADAYFASRPRGSQLGAWASLQSQPLPQREVLIQRLDAEEQRFEGKDVERPSHWTGYRVAPERIELWHAGDSRLHDRTVYSGGSGRWTIQKLYP